MLTASNSYRHEEMMDEIDLQLCLNIDPDPTAQSPREAQPQSKAGSRKRAASCFGFSGEDSELGFESSLPDSQHHTVVNDAVPGRGNGNGNSGDWDNSHQGQGYLSLPPHKRARTSLSVSSILESTRLGFVETGDGPRRNTTAGDMETVPVAGTGSALELPCLNQTLTVEHPSTRDTRTEVDMDFKDAARADTVEENQPPSQPHYQHFLPPSLPFAEPTSLPGLPHILTSSRPCPLRRPEAFEIYEDPLGLENMDIDLAYFIDPSWYLSPDDDKENEEETAEQQPTEPEHRIEQNYHLTYADLGVHDSDTSLLHQHQPYPGNNIIHSQDSVSSAATGRGGRDSPSTLWSSVPRSSMSNEEGIYHHTG